MAASEKTKALEVAYKKAIDYVDGGGEIEIIETKYQLTASVKEALTRK